VPSPDAGLIKGAPQRSRRSKFNWREPSSDSVTRNTAKFLSADASVRGLGNNRSSEGDDAHTASRAPESSGADAVRIPLGPAKWVRCMPVRRLRGLIHHLAERPKTLVFSAFSGRSSISEHLPLSSERAWPRRSSRGPQAPPPTVCTPPRGFTPDYRNARGAWTSRGFPSPIGAGRAQLASNLPPWDAMRSILRRDFDGAVGETAPTGALRNALRGGGTG